MNLSRASAKPSAAAPQAATLTLGSLTDIVVVMSRSHVGFADASAGLPASWLQEAGCRPLVPFRHLLEGNGLYLYWVVRIRHQRQNDLRQSFPSDNAPFKIHWLDAEAVVLIIYHGF
jgi:hypothetical protein